MNNQNLLRVIFGLILGLFVILMLLFGNWESVNFWLSLVWISVGIVSVYFSSSFLLQSPNRDFPVDTVFPLISIGYLGFTVLFSILAAGFFDLFWIWFFTVHLTVFVIYVVIMIFSQIGRRTIKATDQQTLSDVGQLRQFSAELQRLEEKLRQCSENVQASISPHLRALSEKVRYSDPISHSSVVHLSRQIETLIGSLHSAFQNISGWSEEEVEKLKEQIAQISTLVDERNRLVRLSKN